MAMITRCPGCNTAFRVGAEQLQVRSGEVRCGRCEQVFNAFDSLTTVPEPEITAPAATESVPGGVAEEERVAQEAETASVEHPEPLLPEAAPANEPEPEPEPQPEPQPELKPEPKREAEPAPSPRTDEAFEFLVEKPREPHRRLWAAGSVLLLLVLAGQLAYHFRTELAALVPPSRPYLEALCQSLDCDVPLPRKGELLSIDTSDLKADPEQPHLMTLSVALRNRAPFPQAFPALELTLTDSDNQPLARRVFMPVDYLRDGQGIKAGIAANQEAFVLLTLDSGELRPAGYRLYTFYP